MRPAWVKQAMPDWFQGKYWAAIAYADTVLFILYQAASFSGQWVSWAKVIKVYIKIKLVFSLYYAKYFYVGISHHGIWHYAAGQTCMASDAIRASKVAECQADYFYRQ